MIKKIIITFVVLGCLICLKDAISAEYNPPFELSGVVVRVNIDSLEVQMPYINKQVNVMVQPKTKISNRLKENDRGCELSEISVQDLVVVKGILRQDIFLSTEISFLPN